MIDIEEILPYVIATIVAIALFFGFVSAIKKSWKPTSSHRTIDSRMKMKEQKLLMDDVRQRQKQLIRDQKQKMRDMQRR